MTQSEIRYLAILNDYESVLTMQYWSKAAHASCKAADKPIMYPLEKTRLCGEAVRQSQPIITNYYNAPHPHKLRTPESHVPITLHMNIPVFSGERIVAIAGVENKQTDYDDRDLRQLQLLIERWQHIVYRKRPKRTSANMRPLCNPRTARWRRPIESPTPRPCAKSAFLANMSHEIRTPMTRSSVMRTCCPSPP